MDNQTKREKYAYLDQLSTEQLEELLRADLESAAEEDYSEVVFHILEVIEAREQATPTGRLVDVEQSWNEFQQYYNVPEGKGASLYPYPCQTSVPCTAKQETAVHAGGGRPPRRYRRKRFFIVVAAAILLVVLMIGAQAAGLDVFGALARWTDETFHFTSTKSRQNTPEFYNQLQDTLNEHEIPRELIPTWYPEGSELLDLKAYDDSFAVQIKAIFSIPDGRTFFVSIIRYHVENDFGLATFEKDSASVELYQNGSQSFYILSNLDAATATWADGYFEETISGELSVDEIKQMIDSIGGP